MRREVSQASQVVSEVFMSLATLLRSGQIVALGVTSTLAARSLREELLRRDELSRTLHLWGASKYWDVLLGDRRCLSWRCHKWCALPPMPEARVGAVCAMIGRYIYVCGGSRHGQPTNALERLCLERGRWEPLPPLLGRRRVDAEGTAVGVLDGQLFVCGGLGFDGTTASSCADCFDPEEHFWETLPAMPQRRYRAAAAVACGQLYICGGSDGGPGGAPLSSVIRFDRGVGAWEAMPPMIERRGGPAAIFANGSIYVGDCSDQGAQPVVPVFDCRLWLGADMPSSLISGERFNMETTRWSRCPPGLLTTPGASVASVMNSCLYICGGSAHGPSLHGDARRVAGTEHAALVAGDRGTEEPAASAGSRMLRRNWTT